MRCYLPPDQWMEGPVTLDREESHYMGDVLRVDLDQTIEIFDGVGRVGSAKITGRSKEAVTVEIQRVKKYSEPVPAIQLVQSLPKSRRMDWIIQKAVELGAQAIHPIRTQNTVVRVNHQQGIRKIERWKAIAKSASRQCGAMCIPQIHPICSLAQWLHVEGRPEVILVGDLRSSAEPVRQVLEELRDQPLRSIAMVIGPEGDLSAEEFNTLEIAGARMVGFGETVLRTETAAIFALSLLRYVYR